MKKIAKLFSLALISLLLASTSALALLNDHDYTVQLHTLSATGQQNMVVEMPATTDANGKLNFQFTDVPDSDTSQFLMVQIMDSGTMVRQSMVPAPKSGQQLQMGISAISHSQTRAALQAMGDSSGTSSATLRAMFPLTMIMTGAMSDAYADSMGVAANEAATAFCDSLTNNGATTAQMTGFQAGVIDAMRTFAADNKTAVDNTDPATEHFGQANAQLITTMMLAGEAAGIDSDLLAAAFDDAGRAIENSKELNSIPTTDFAAMQATYMTGTRQRHLLSQMGGYTTAMTVVGANSTVTTEMNTLQRAMDTARMTFWQKVFGDPTTLPSPDMIDLELDTMEMDMQSALDDFTMSTDARSQVVGSMLDTMSNNMGGGMMSGSTLSGLNLGMMQTTVGGQPQNWSLMMVAASNLLPATTEKIYTPNTTNLTDQLTQLSPISMPVAPIMSLLPEGPEKSFLQLQYDLMLVHLIDLQMAENLAPLDQTDMADISAADLANRNMILQGMTGLTDEQKKAMVNALSQMHLS